MPTGIVKWFNADKGFGFIQPQEDGPDVFAHAVAVQRAGLDTLQVGQKLEYDTESGRSGKPQVKTLRLVGSQLQQPSGSPQRERAERAFRYGD
jgi:CspA family cold shock protein